jgi:hypothetical protein
VCPSDSMNLIVHFVFSSSYTILFPIPLIPVI